MGSKRTAKRQVRVRKRDHRLRQLNQLKIAVIVLQIVKWLFGIWRDDD
jgi:hypothetical protein